LSAPQALTIKGFFNAVIAANALDSVIDPLCQEPANTAGLNRINKSLQIR
jgi:hypothetical protein